jgi:hypothetical protein
MKKKTLTILIIIFIVGCASDRAYWNSISTSISNHKNVSEKIELGDTKENVLAILLPTQELLKTYPHEQKQPDKHIKDDVLVEIYFMRSGWFRDNITSDDEFTPYVFNDGKLVGIGWSILGGPSTQGQTRSVTNVETTIINEPPPIQLAPLPFPHYP